MRWGLHLGVMLQFVGFKEICLRQEHLTIEYGSNEVDEEVEVVLSSELP